MTVRTMVLACALALAACGGSNTQSQGASGDDTTGSREGNQGRVATSGGELGEGEGTCTATPVYFAYDSSELDPSARAALEANARCLISRRSGARLVGMTDPRGTEEYNLALGDRRAQTVSRYLSNLGVDGSQLTSQSFGEENASGDDESGWARDRRVEVQLQ